MNVTEVPAAEAVEFVRRWHYSGSAAPGVARYGWYDDRGRLLGVSIFDTGNHAMREGVFGPGHWQHVLHHHRLAVHPSIPHGMTSQFLAASLRALHRDHPEVRAVVSYADSDQGHVGTVYQAVNGTYTGRVGQGNLYLRDRRGAIRTMQSLKRYGTWPERRAVARELGWVEHRSAGKHRYVFVLGTARQRRHYPALRWPVLPYPKRSVDTTCRRPPAPRVRWRGLVTKARTRVCSVRLSAQQSACLQRRCLRERVEGRGPPIRSAAGNCRPQPPPACTATRGSWSPCT